MSDAGAARQNCAAWDCLPNQCLHSAEADVRPPRRESRFDPTATSASISCCSSEAGFSPYQSTRLSRICCRLLSSGANMRRREFVAALGGEAAWPVVARAQNALHPARDTMKEYNLREPILPAAAGSRRLPSHSPRQPALAVWRRTSLSSGALMIRVAH
jgi:hypothetical protein